MVFIGEHITDSELADCLGALFGYALDEAGAEPPEAAAQLEEQLPEEVSMQMFGQNILGFPN